MKLKHLPKFLYDFFSTIADFLFFVLMVMFDIVLLAEIQREPTSLLEIGITFLMLIETRRQYKKLFRSLRV